MSDPSTHASSIPSPDEVRPLPPRPNLEFERKAAKHLLRDALAGDENAVDRLRAPRAELDASHQWQLADAQFAVAREYGFASWPKLAAYFAQWERHEKSQPSRATYRSEWYEDEMRRDIKSHQTRRWWVAPSLAAYVPRLYGKTDDEIFDAPLTEAEAQLTVARRNRFISWDALMHAAANATPQRAPESPQQPMGRALAAIRAEDLAALQSVVAEHPELIGTTTTPSERAMIGVPKVSSFIDSALRHERTSRSAAAREIGDWLAMQGADVQTALDAGLIGGMRMTADDFEWLIARGANVNWIPPNGMSLLEHALLRCWNPGPADVLARYVKPRKAFWVAAGMNDVHQLKAYFAADGSLTDAARNDRPDYIAAQMPMLSRPGADDREILWEVAGVAIFNQRWAALDYLLTRGFDIDYSPWRFNYLHWAVGNTVVAAVEGLVQRGANVDLKGWHPYSTAREIAAERLESNPDVAEIQRICELVGVT